MAVGDHILSEHLGIAILSELEPFALMTQEDRWRVSRRLAGRCSRPAISTGNTKVV